MAFVRVFSEIDKSHSASAGGKGASLGEMTKAGIPVPPGFVVLSSAFDRFLEETNLSSGIAAILGTVNTEVVQTVEAASEKIQALILAKQMPADIHSQILENYRMLGTEFVAVRSSATAEDSASAAWAGQLDSFLNTTEKTLIENVRKCWASLFTPRAVFYRFEMLGKASPQMSTDKTQMNAEKISVAVVVQKMVVSEVSGVAFSVHPVTEDKNQMIIEAGFGLGEAIVSGQITPDSYVVTKEPRSIVDVTVSEQDRFIIRAREGMSGNQWVEVPQEKQNQQKLSNDHILELSELLLRIEKHYGFPVDVEWALEGAKLYITQSRPITTLS